jgi:membrane protein implicated in regulation of membrane protease activity
MKTFTLAMIGVFLTAMATTAAVAACATAVCSVHGAPAPLIGGLPAMLVIGGVWLGRRLLKRTRRQD